MCQAQRKNIWRETNNNGTNKLYTVLQGVSAAKKNRGRGGVGVVMG